MASLFGFGEKPQDVLNVLSNSDLTATDQLTSPVTAAPETLPGADMTTMHFSITTRLGWIQWKETECSLYSIFERAFAASRCELKFSDSMDQMAMEVEIPNSQVDKFTKYFNRDILAAEIDKLHGLEPVLTRYRDAKLSGLKKTLGSVSANVNEPSSVEALLKRIESLEQCGTVRDKEITGIIELATQLTHDMTARFDSVVERIDARIFEKCGSKIETIEEKLLMCIRDDLGFIKNMPNRLAQLCGVQLTGGLADSMTIANMRRASSIRPVSRSASGAAVADDSEPLPAIGSMYVSITPKPSIKLASSAILSPTAGGASPQSPSLANAFGSTSPDAAAPPSPSGSIRGLSHKKSVSFGAPQILERPVALFTAAAVPRPNRDASMSNLDALREQRRNDQETKTSPALETAPTPNPNTEPVPEAANGQTTPGSSAAEAASTAVEAASDPTPQPVPAPQVAIKDIVVEEYEPEF
ncbi:hypothetical protein BC831DRAFT_485385 [Entophlyctis helioformis]|nr:hypothetical protein BC831DRAFT_485385 [Entophlyctis helioformis]